MLKNRLVSLDVFRGMTLVGMVLVNNPGSWSHVYQPFLHAKWHGCTFTDLIFPFFLFIVGVSIALAIGKRKKAGADKSALLRKIAYRTLVIFLCGLFLHLFPHFNFSSVRIPGVLQRIAVVYGITATLFLFVNWRWLLGIGIVLLLSYWALMTLVPVPGFGSPNLDPSTNLGAYIDRYFLDGHLWRQSETWDPEGILSTFPALVTSISGILTGLWLRRVRENPVQLMGMVAVGGLLIITGLWWNLAFPINKQLWTSSYVLYTGGIAVITLAVIYWLTDVKQYRYGTFPFIAYGMNSLFVFVASGLVAKSLSLVRWTTGDSTVTLGRWIYHNLFTSWLPDFPASLSYALLHILVFYLVLRWMYHRRFFIKI